MPPNEILAIDCDPTTIRSLRKDGAVVRTASFGYADGHRYCEVPPHEVDLIVFDLSTPACYDMNDWGNMTGVSNSNYRVTIVPSKQVTWETHVVGVPPNRSERLRFAMIDDLQIASMNGPTPFGPADIRQAIERAGVDLVIFLNPAWALRATRSDFPNVCGFVWSLKAAQSSRVSAVEPITSIWNDILPTLPITVAIVSTPRPVASTDATPLATTDLISDPIGNVFAQVAHLGAGRIWLLPPTADNGRTVLALSHSVLLHDPLGTVSNLEAICSPGSADVITTSTPAPVIAPAEITDRPAIPSASVRAPIKLLASYAHQEPAYNAAVLAVVQRLRGDGVDAWSDHFVVFPPEGWPAWMSTQLRSRRFVLVFVSEIYQRRTNREEEPHRGLGVIWEHGYVRSELYESGRINERFLPVGFGPEARAFVPHDLRDFTYFDLASDEDYQKLLCVLRDEQHIVPQMIGEIGATSVSFRAPDPSAEEMARRYQGETASDREHSNWMIPATNGLFAMTLRPVEYVAERLARAHLTSALNTIRVAYPSRDGAIDSMPFEQNTDLVGFGSGTGMETSLTHPEWKRVERVRIHRSGQYRLTRVFEEDYGADNALKNVGLELWNEYFIRRTTMLFRLAVRWAETIALTSTDILEMSVKITGLGNRRLVPLSKSPDAHALYVLMGAKSGREAFCERRYVLTREELSLNCVSLSHAMLCDIYWNFGLTDDLTAKFISEIQRVKNV